MEWIKHVFGIGSRDQPTPDSTPVDTVRHCAYTNVWRVTWVKRCMVPLLAAEQ